MGGWRREEESATIIGAKQFKWLFRVICRRVDCRQFLSSFGGSCGGWHVKRTCFPLKAAWAVHLIGLTWYMVWYLLVAARPVYSMSAVVVVIQLWFDVCTYYNGQREGEKEEGRRLIILLAWDWECLSTWSDNKRALSEVKLFVVLQ